MMQKQMWRQMLWSTMVAAGLIACSDARKNTEKEEKTVTTVLPEVKNEVTVQVLTRRAFHHELVSNGKVTAGRQADLRFETAGVVANLFAKPYNMANVSETFCTIVDTHGMEADFAVLENELSFIKTGDPVTVIPYAGGGELEGRVASINPLVDANGMVKVRATVDGRGRLFSGMNVRVSVKRRLEDQLVLPKTAVVLRSGKQVVFTLKGGKAMWNYVQTGLENATECVVSDKSQRGADRGLMEGDTVIVTGNLNLAHEAKVEVKS